MPWQKRSLSNHQFIHFAVIYWNCGARCEPPYLTCCRTHRALPLSLPHPTMVQLFHIAIATVGQRNERQGKKKKRKINLRVGSNWSLRVSCFCFFHDSPITPPATPSITGPLVPTEWQVGLSVCLLTQSISSAELLDLVSRKPAADWDLLPNGCADCKTENRIGQEWDL